MLIAIVIKWPIAEALAAQQLRAQQKVINILLWFLTAAIGRATAAVRSQNRINRFIFY